MILHNLSLCISSNYFLVRLQDFKTERNLKMANKMTQVKAIAIAIVAIENGDISSISTEVLAKLKDVKIALEKKGGKVSAKADEKRAEKYNAVKAFFDNTPKTLTAILDANRDELKELGVMSPQGLLGAIRVGVENGEIIREKDKKTTTFRLA